MEKCKVLKDSRLLLSLRVPGLRILDRCLLVTVFWQVQGQDHQKHRKGRDIELRVDTKSGGCGTSPNLWCKEEPGIMLTGQSWKTL